MQRLVCHRGVRLHRAPFGLTPDTIFAAGSGFILASMGLGWGLFASSALGVSWAVISLIFSRGNLPGALFTALKFSIQRLGAKQ